MIVVDFSSNMHRMIYTSSKECIADEDGKFKTEDYIYFAMHLILSELYSIHEEHKNKYGNLVLCLDNSSGGYWRKDIFPRYKESRKSGRDESPYKWDEIFSYIDKLLDCITQHLPWKVVSVPRAEADDTILALSRHYNTMEKILIHSPDKDMIQAQKGTTNVQQYSALTKKWIVPEHKNDDMEDWLLEHVCLGDSSDGVPRIVDETIFSDNFKEHLKNNNILIDNPVDFKEKLDKETKVQLLNTFTVYKTNKAGEETELDIYLKERIGISTLKKKIDKIGGLEAFLDSHPMYRPNYERNYKLVMEDGIPSDIWNNIILNYKEALADYNATEFEKFLDENNLGQLKMIMNFESTKALTIEDFGW